MKSLKVKRCAYTRYMLHSLMYYFGAADGYLKTLLGLLKTRDVRSLIRLVFLGSGGEGDEERMRPSHLC